ncbi:hypothetical protein L210DRAFT_3510144, partial [Boletus edulis BED1]
MTRTRLSLACLTFLSFLGRLTGLGSGPQAFGGGPPAIKTGDVLVAAGVNLVTAHGGTKVGLLSRVLQDSTEQSLQERIQSGSDRNLRWVVSQGDETYECQMLRVRDMTELGKKTTLEQFHALWSLSRKDERQHRSIFASSASLSNINLASFTLQHDWTFLALASTLAFLTAMTLGPRNGLPRRVSVMEGQSDAVIEDFKHTLSRKMHERSTIVERSRSPMSIHVGEAEAAGQAHCCNMLHGNPDTLLGCGCEVNVCSVTLGYDEEHAATTLAVQKFREGDGPALQERLKQWAAGRASDGDQSSVAQLYRGLLYESYLSHTDPVVLAFNPFFVLENDPTPNRGSQLPRAAALIISSLGFIHDLRAGLQSHPFAETRLCDLICQYDCQALEFKGLDAFVQMAFQAAYFGLYGRTECTYKPAMTKAFLHGRTEAIRTVQPESVEFTKMFLSEAYNQERILALRRACERHVALMKECSQGLRQDSVAIHLCGPWLELTWHFHSIDVELWKPCSPAFGSGPVAAGGYGIGYIIKENGISIVASSRHPQTKTVLGYVAELPDGCTAYPRSALPVGQREAGSTGRPINGSGSDDGASDGYEDTMMWDTAGYSLTAAIWNYSEAARRVRMRTLRLTFSPELPYPYDALQPYISEQVMRLHHMKHHQGYVNALDAAETSYVKAATRIALQAVLKSNGGAYVDNDSAAKLNVGLAMFECTLILHTALGKDDFISVSGCYQYTCFANTLERLRNLKSPEELLACWTGHECADRDHDMLFEHPVQERLCHVIRE